MNQPISSGITIVGAGIVGLAMAYTAASQGHQVRVFERNSRPVGASIRNFGMIWPIGQAPGPTLQRALRSRQIWEKVGKAAGFWHHPNGSLHLAYQADEWAVLEEFAATAASHGYEVELLSPAETRRISPAAKPTGLIGSLYSRTEMLVDPREVPGKLIPWLESVHSVQFHFDCAVSSIEDHRLQAGGKTYRAEQVYVCCGDELETLFPEILQAAGMTKVKLQMMRTAPQAYAWQMGPSICGGLTLTHYASFADCASLPALRDRIQRETPHFPEWGIHVMMAQNGRGELVIGDSHEYDTSHGPFLREEVNDYILDYLRNLVEAPSLEIAERWYGVYAKLPGKTEFVHQVREGVTLVTGLGGAGMTLSFGLAAELLGTS